MKFFYINTYTNNTIRNFSPTAKVYTIYSGINNNKILIKQ